MTEPAIPTLRAGAANIPAIGFGTSQLGDCAETVATALRLGYRHIDTAWKYGTEKGVGQGIKASGVPRGDRATPRRLRRRLAALTRPRLCSNAVRWRDFHWRL